MPQHQDLTLPQRQASEGPHELVVPFTGKQAGVGRRLVRWGVWLVSRGYGSAAQHRVGSVGHAAAKVGQRLVGIPQSVPATVHGDEGVLDDVLSRVGVSDQQGGQPDK